MGFFGFVHDLCCCFGLLGFVGLCFMLLDSSVLCFCGFFVLFVGWWVMSLFWCKVRVES